MAALPPAGGGGEVVVGGWVRWGGRVVGMMSTWLRAQTDGSWKALGAARKGGDVAEHIIIIIWRSCRACARRLCAELKPSPPSLPPGVDVGIKVICQSSLMPDLHLPLLHVNAGSLTALHCSVNPD